MSICIYFKKKGIEKDWCVNIKVNDTTFNISRSISFACSLFLTCSLLPSLLAFNFVVAFVSLLPPTFSPLHFFCRALLAFHNNILCTRSRSFVHLIRHGACIQTRVYSGHGNRPKVYRLKLFSYLFAQHNIPRIKLSLIGIFTKFKQLDISCANKNVYHCSEYFVSTLFVKYVKDVNLQTV